MGARERFSSAVLSGSNDRLCQPERRRRQDDDRSQSRDRSRPHRPAGPRRRSRPPGKCHERLRNRPFAASTAPCTTCSSSDRDLDSVIIATAVDGCAIAPASVALAGAEIELATAPQRERRLTRALAGVTRPLRLCPGRLSAVAGPVDGQCAHGGDLRPHPDAVRVLRPGGSLPVDRHPEPRPRQPEPDAGHQGRRAHDVRRPDEPVVRRRRRRSAATSDTPSSTR